MLAVLVVIIGSYKVLQLYRDPKTFSIKNLIYGTEEDFAALQREDSRGLILTRAEGADA